MRYISFNTIEKSIESLSIPYEEKIFLKKYFSQLPVEGIGPTVETKASLDNKITPYIGHALSVADIEPLKAKINLSILWENGEKPNGSLLTSAFCSKSKSDVYFTLQELTNQIYRAYEIAHPASEPNDTE